MIAAARAQLLRLLKVPPEPEPPTGSHTSLRVFRAAKNYYRLLLLHGVLKQASVVIGTLVTLHFLGEWTAHLNPAMAFWIRLAEWLGLAGVAAQMPFTLALVKLDYELRWYIVTDRSLRIRAGIWDIRELTMTFANIQQITVEQGPLQRLLGLADVLVRTAGGGSGGEQPGQAKGKHELMHLGFFHGVNNAQEIRDLILDRMRRLRDSGLGDPDDVSSEPISSAIEARADSVAQLLAGARALAAESRALTEALVVSRS